MAKRIPKAAHVFIRGEGGGVFKLDLPLHETIEERLSKGYIVRVANAAGDPYVEGADAPEVPAPPTKRPSLKAAKPKWVGWAVVNGMTPDDAEALTVTDLIERFGAEPVDPTDADDSDDEESEEDDESEEESDDEGEEPTE